MQELWVGRHDHVTDDCLLCYRLDPYIIWYKELLGERWQANDLIFPSSVGTPINPSNLRKDFLRVLANAGLSTIRFHDLRHTAASLMLNHGIPPLVVSKILGHSKPSITLDIYGHQYNEMQSEAARLIDSLVKPTVKKTANDETLEINSIFNLSGRFCQSARNCQ